MVGNGVKDLVKIRFCGCRDHGIVRMQEREREFILSFFAVLALVSTSGAAEYIIFSSFFL
ncbi:hypothetical protein FRX31_023032 [Thalictrum thalictroides]|uniref:Uncharacterized protein n=1 Tax=Thalictrum thalictroides TaxID=46969 RepID=A0A7J6VRJ9_THATH|nr:hypothetical protein FRX31_023032 [Thalictrum thalictroides]